MRVFLSAFVFPAAHALLVLFLQFSRLFVHCFGVGKGFFDAGPAPPDDVEHGFVKKAFQDPNEDQEIDDLEDEGRPAQLQLIAPYGIFRWLIVIAADTQAEDCGTAR